MPVAGADRLDIGEHIAVHDLVAAGRAALLPDDDLTLADGAEIAARRPRRRRPDAHRRRPRRRRSRWPRPSRRHAEAGDAAARPRPARRWRAWRDSPAGTGRSASTPRCSARAAAGAARRAARRRGGRRHRRLPLPRADAELSPRRPRSTTFLARFESASAPRSSAISTPTRDEVRVMTVHGAKGLEAPIVILIDGCEVLGRDPTARSCRRGRHGAAIPVWSPARPTTAAASRQAREALQRPRPRGAQPPALRRHDPGRGPARDRALHDRRQGAAPEEAWCEMVRRGSRRGRRRSCIDEAPYGACRACGATARARWPADGEARLAAGRRSQPSRLAGDAASPRSRSRRRRSAPRARSAPPIALTRPGDGPYAPDARLRGVLVHALLERLPAVAPERRGRSPRGLPRGARAAARGRRSGPPGRRRPRACSTMRRWRRCSGPAPAPRPRSPGTIRLGGDGPAGFRPDRPARRVSTTRSSSPITRPTRPPAARDEPAPPRLRGAARPLPRAARGHLSRPAGARLPDLDRRAASAGVARRRARDALEAIKVP